MKISEREMILGVATLACVLVGVTWYTANGKVAEWKEKKDEIASVQRQIREHKAAISKQDDWSGELALLEQELLAFDINQRSVSPELMKTINTLADKYALQITRTTPSGEKPTGDLYELSINCQWQGRLESLVAFLADLQQEGIRYDVRTLNILPRGNNTGLLSGSMIIDCAFTRRLIADQEAN
jgi:Tfp pilus assembly protein PilO